MSLDFWFGDTPTYKEKGENWCWGYLSEQDRLDKVRADNGLCWGLHALVWNLDDTGKSRITEANAADVYARLRAAGNIDVRFVVSTESSAEHAEYVAQSLEWFQPHVLYFDKGTTEYTVGEDQHDYLVFDVTISPTWVRRCIGLSTNHGSATKAQVLDRITKNARYEFENDCSDRTLLAHASIETIVEAVREVGKQCQPKRAIKEVAQ